MVHKRKARADSVIGQATPGPWEAEFDEVTSVLDSERGRICTINWLRGPHGSFGRRKDAEGEANARLIVAAPEMLALIKWFIAALGKDETLQGGERVGLTDRSRINGAKLNGALIEAKRILDFVEGR